MTVYVPNDYAHSATDAERWGKLVYLTTGQIGRMQVKQHVNTIRRKLRNSQPTDHVVVCGLSVISALAVGVFMERHGRASLLIWDRGQYHERIVT